MTTAYMSSDIPGLTAKRGKVRDIYDLGQTLLLVTTDRISAYDWVLPNGIPNKGRVLQALTVFWLQHLQQNNHFITANPEEIAEATAQDDCDPHLIGRSMLVEKVNPFPVECIVRGYLAGSGWKEYQKHGTTCDIELPAGLVEGARLDKPIFTPSTKAESGHDENISFEQMCKVVGKFVNDELLGTTLSQELKTRSLNAYAEGESIAYAKGVIIADTKFEFGLTPNKPIGPAAITLIDEVLTPDSSRFWPTRGYVPGQSQPSFDKQFIRDWLTNEAKWDKNSEPPALPKNIVTKTAEKYIEAFTRLTGTDFPWK